MSGPPSTYHLRVGLSVVLLSGLWEYAQVTPLYRCWGRWTTRQRIWILPALTVGSTA